MNQHCILILNTKNWNTSNCKQRICVLTDGTAAQDCTPPEAIARPCICAAEAPSCPCTCCDFCGSNDQHSLVLVGAAEMVAPQHCQWLSWEDLHQLRSRKASLLAWSNHHSPFLRWQRQEWQDNSFSGRFVSMRLMTESWVTSDSPVSVTSLGKQCEQLKLRKVWQSSSELHKWILRTTTSQHGPCSFEHLCCAAPNSFTQHQQ